MCIRLPKPLNPNAQAWTPSQIQTTPPIPVLPHPPATATYRTYTVNELSQPYYLPHPRIFPPAVSGFRERPTSYSGEEIHILQRNSKGQKASWKANGPMQRCPPRDGLNKGFRGHCPPRLRRPVNSVSVEKKSPKLGWRPRKLAEPDNESVVDLPQPSVSLPVAPLSGRGFSPSWNTTVMIKNIPNRLRRDDILEFLDGHCCAHSLEYDFLYLPMDFRNKGNFGYAFVNFTTATAANKFKKILQNFKWETVKIAGGSFISTKICEITWARIQGKEDYARRFKNAKFACHELDFLPVVLDPPRNGSDPNPCPPLVLGNTQLRRRCRFSSKNHD